MKKLLLSLAIIIAAASCKEPVRNIQNGMWRGVLETSDGSQIPFNFELQALPGDTVMNIITGTDLYPVKDIHRMGDSLFISMPLFSSSFRLMLAEDGSLTGKFLKGNYEMPFTATPGVTYRFFETPQTPSVNGAGRWLVTLGKNELIGEFASDGDRLTGSFLSPSGDYRFFEGGVSTDGKLMMSCFDGGFVRLFTGDMVGNDSLANVKMYSGFSSVAEGSAIRKEDAQLPDAYAITGMKKGYSSFGFSFPDINGKQVSLKDDKFKDKVIVLQISGSWCPNCLDETRFLTEMYKKYQPNLEVVCLAFERSTEYDAARTDVMKLVDLCGVPYDVLVTCMPTSGVKDALPELDNFKSFPTTIIIDKKGVVQRIHAGFSGPGTGVHYTNFVNEFTTFIEGLMK